MSTSTPRRSTRTSVTRSVSLEPTETPVSTTPSRKSDGRISTNGRQTTTTVATTSHGPRPVDSTPRRRSSRLSATPTPSCSRQHTSHSLRYTIKEEEDDHDHLKPEGHIGVDEYQSSSEERRSSHDTSGPESWAGTPHAQGNNKDNETDEASRRSILANRDGQEGGSQKEEEEDLVEAVLAVSRGSHSHVRRQSFGPYSQPHSTSVSQRVSPLIASSESDRNFTASQRSARKISPLTSTERAIRRFYFKRKILATISASGPVVRTALILTALGLLSILPAPMSPFAKNTYVDENALQPGSANVYWEWSEVGICDALSREIKALEQIQADATQRADYISSKLLDFGLEPRTQAYHFEVPTTASSTPTSTSLHSGLNTYARWQSSRSDGREAVIIAASWLSRWDGTDDPDVSDEQDTKSPSGFRRTNNRGIAIVLALSKYLSAQSHWSKDIIFVFSDDYMEGMQAWVTSYFGTKQSNLEAEPLTCTGAVVWNSIAVDYPSDSFSSLVVLHDGLDGQLPNMDILNTLVKVADRMGRIPVYLPGESGVYTREDDLAGGTWGPIGKWLEDKMWGWRGVAKYRKGTANLLRQMRSQAFGHPSGIHGLFQRFHVDAITLYAVPARGPYGFWNLGRVMESMMRSFSNLLERLHHSQFFYLLTMSDKFVPLGVYLPVPLLLSIASTLTGIAVWMQAGREGRARKQEFLEWTASLLRPLIDTSDPPYQNDLPLENPAHADLQIELAQLVIKSGLEGEGARRRLAELLTVLDAQSRPTAGALLVMGACHGAGAVALSLLLQPRPSLGIASIVTSLTPLAMALVARSWSGMRGGTDASTPSDSWSVGLPLAQILHAFTLLETGMAVAVLSVLNFSAATVMALLLVLPLYAVYVPRQQQQQTPDRGKPPVSIKARLAAALMTLWYLFILLPFNVPHLLRGLALFAPHFPSWIPLTFESLLQESESMTQDALRTLLNDWYFLRSAFLPILCLVYTPIVLQAVAVTALVLVA